MKREITKWTIDKLIENGPGIGFPEFQREPNVWDLPKKRKLIDSIFRGFDISPIYLYKKSTDSYDCIDGRQRLNAINCFRGLSDDQKDNGFSIVVENEIYTEQPESSLNEILKRIAHKKYAELGEDKKIFDKYELNVIIIDTNLDDVLELNLLFARLQLGETLNSGEKLHAMSGEMKNFIFKSQPEGIQGHEFFTGINVPYKRYAREQIAAQIVLNYFGLKSEKKDFLRSRYICRFSSLMTTFSKKFSQ